MYLDPSEPVSGQHPDQEGLFGMPSESPDLRESEMTIPPSGEAAERRNLRLVPHPQTARNLGGSGRGRGRICRCFRFLRGRGSRPAAHLPSPPRPGSGCASGPAARSRPGLPALSQAGTRLTHLGWVAGVGETSAGGGTHGGGPGPSPTAREEASPGRR